MKSKTNLYIKNITIFKNLFFLCINGIKFNDKFWIFIAIICFFSYYILKIILSPIVRMKSHLFGRFLLKDVTTKNSYGIFYCRANTADINVIGDYNEQSIVELVRKKLKEKDIFIDIGAHIGKYAILASKLVGERGKVLAIEAHPKNFKILKKNIKLNNLKNVELANYACWNKNIKIKLYEDYSGAGNSVVDKTNKFILIDALQLDYILSKAKINKNKVNLIKIDVEGAESKVFCGAEELLRKGKNLEIIFEVWDEEYLKICRKVLRKFNYKSKKIANMYYLAYKSFPVNLV